METICQNNTISDKSDIALGMEATQTDICTIAQGAIQGLRGVRELFRVRLDMFKWSDMIFTTFTHIWTKVISIIIRCPEDYHLPSPVQSPTIPWMVTIHP